MGAGAKIPLKWQNHIQIDTTENHSQKSLLGIRFQKLVVKSDRDAIYCRHSDASINFHIELQHIFLRHGDGEKEGYGMHIFASCQKRYFVDVLNKPRRYGFGAAQDVSSSGIVSIAAKDSGGVKGMGESGKMLDVLCRF